MRLRSYGCAVKKGKSLTSPESTEKISHGLTGKRRGEDKLFRFTYFKLSGKPGLYGFVNCGIGMFFFIGM